MSDAPSPTPAKVCMVCKQDCSQRPRVKDAQGRYMCKECEAKKLTEQAAKAAPKPAPPSPAAPIALEEDAIDWDKVVANEESKPQLASCPSCKATMSPGAMLCTSCGFDKATGKKRKVSLKSSGDSGSTAGNDLLLPALWLGVGLVGALVTAFGWSKLDFLLAGVRLPIYVWWLIACVIGGLPAVAVGFTAKARCGVVSGLIGAVCAFGGMFLGHYWALSSKVSEFMKIDQAIVVTDQDGIVEMAERLATTEVAAGKTLKWPDGYSMDNAEKLEHFPKDIAERASAQWESLDSLAQHRFKESLREQWERSRQKAHSMITRGSILETLGVLDYLLCVVSMGIGYWVASDKNEWFS